MKHRDQFAGKHVLIVGLAKSGYSAAKLLHKRGASIVVNDLKSADENEQARALHDKGIETIFGSHPLSLLDRNIDFIVKNPGIRYDNPLIAEAIKRKIPVLTEVELAWKITEAAFIGITGSNGKTTTTTLIGEMLKNGKKRPLIAGNIGTVASDVAEQANGHTVLVTELSSFQLMGVHHFKPKIAVLLNIFDAHLDYHGTRYDYMKAKAKLIANQTKKDYTVYNADDEDVVKMVENSSATLIPFSRKTIAREGAYIKDGQLFFKNEPVVAVEQILLPGEHNLENILAAVATAKLEGVRNDWIKEVLANFRGVRHRLEYIGNVNGRKFYNDSKATNLLATEKAITAFSDPVILLAGGLDRGNGFAGLIPSLQKHVKAVISFGETGEQLKNVAEQAGMRYSEVVDNVEQAVQAAYHISSPGDVILLSPACASWDQFKTFAERGDMFARCVHKLEM